jgi:hypothetical protein
MLKSPMHHYLASNPIFYVFLILDTSSFLTMNLWLSKESNPQGREPLKKGKAQQN